MKANIGLVNTQMFFKSNIIFLLKGVRSHINKTNLQYISEDNCHLTSLFCELKLRIYSLTKMVLKPNLAKFVESIVSPTIILLSLLTNI